MKFIVNSSYLLKQLSNINGVITTNPVVPILENFLFEIDKSNLKVTASDLQTSMITEINVESKEKGSIAVPARILLDTLKNLPDQPVTFSIDSTSYAIEISSDNGRYKLARMRPTSLKCQRFQMTSQHIFRQRCWLKQLIIPFSLPVVTNFALQ
jgi:DNA polymerase-3 subunit beta